MHIGITFKDKKLYRPCSLLERLPLSVQRENGWLDGRKTQRCDLDCRPGDDDDDDGAAQKKNGSFEIHFYCTQEQYLPGGELATRSDGNLVLFCSFRFTTSARGLFAAYETPKGDASIPNSKPLARQSSRCSQESLARSPRRRRRRRHFCCRL